MSDDDFEALLHEDGWREAESDDARATVMIVDDDPAIRNALRSMLERRYRVLLVDSAEGAVAAVSEDIHAVVLDIKMKGHDGFWACSEMRKLCPGMPVIFYSAYQDLKDPYRLINEHYPIGYITKGGDTTMLLDAIDTAVKLSTIAMFGKRVLEEHRASREGDVERP